jgi:hypothetical protein
MTWLDVASVALLVIVGWVEAKRGFSPAAIDLCLLLIGLNLAKSLTGAAAQFGSQTAAFSVFFVGAVLVTGVASSVIDSYTKWEIGPYDSAGAGVVGVVVGLVAAHALYHAMALHGHGGQALVGRSLLAPEIYDLRAIHALGDMLRNLGGGPRIIDKVKKAEQ